MQLSDETLPQIAINPYYLSLMKQKDTETEAKDYIEGKIRQAEWVCQCIGQRNQTLSRLAEEILCVQGEFFAKGSGKLAPWTQKQAAKSLGVSEPTLSRTVREKYLQCRWGIFRCHISFQDIWLRRDSGQRIREEWQNGKRRRIRKKRQFRQKW